MWIRARRALARWTAPETPPAPRRDVLPLESELRRLREEEAARRDAARKAASAEEIRRACRSVGHWWPGMHVPPGRFPRSDRENPVAAFAAQLRDWFGGRPLTRGPGKGE